MPKVHFTNTAPELSIPHLPCRFPGCFRRFHNRSGRTQHERARHPLSSGFEANQGFPPTQSTPSAVDAPVPTELLPSPSCSVTIEDEIDVDSPAYLASNSIREGSTSSEPNNEDWDGPRSPIFDRQQFNTPRQRNEPLDYIVTPNLPFAANARTPLPIWNDESPAQTWGWHPERNSSPSSLRDASGAETPPHLPFEHEQSDRASSQSQSSSPVASGLRSQPPHQRNKHRSGRREYHPLINGRPCDKQGNFLPIGMPPPPLHAEKPPNDWTPFTKEEEFEAADFAYRDAQLSAPRIDRLLKIWSKSLFEHGANPLFANHQEMYDTIDSIPLGDVPWQSFAMKYSGPKPDKGSIPSWMDTEHTVWFRDPFTVVKNMLANPDYANAFDFSAYRDFEGKSASRQYKDFMSGDWAWEQSDKIAEESENTHGSMFVPIILGSDKTTVSVATGQTDYYPLYASIGNVHNNIRRGHRNALALIGFLAIAKANNEDADDITFRKFRRQMFHTSLGKILECFKAAMTVPVVLQCPDGHYRRVIFGIGPYIADYPEQCLVACIVQGWCAWCSADSKNLDKPALDRTQQHTEILRDNFTLGELWTNYGLVGDVIPFTEGFPRANIYELIAPDLLHQLIKGTFKDHLVTWVEKYLQHRHGKPTAKKILDDIDRRVSLAPHFARLRRFPDGRGFKQWTGDDSKALMKVYLPAIEGHVPRRIVRAFRAFLEFCYVAQRNVLNEESLEQLKDALQRFHHYRRAFEIDGVRPSGFSLPRQHSLIHYFRLIRAFGSPNGLCSSITESKHIKAVKEPWRRSNRYEAVGQMLLTNQRLDKLAAAQVDFVTRGMLDPTTVLAANGNGEDNDSDGGGDHGDDHGEDPWVDDIEDDEDDDEEETDEEDDVESKPSFLSSTALAKTIQKRMHVSLLELVRRFLYDQLYPNSHLTSNDVSLHACPVYNGAIAIHNSATASFYAPSDATAVNGMIRERIRATSVWRGHRERRDCAFVTTDIHNTHGLDALSLVRVLRFLSFAHNNIIYPCALVRWYEKVFREPDEDTGMWVVRPDVTADKSPLVSIIHIDSLFRAAHLLPIYGKEFVPRRLTMHDTLNIFPAFYINKFIDHHSFEIAS